VRWEKSLQRPQTLFIALCALAEQLKGELGHLLLEGQDFGLQNANRLSQLSLFWQGTRRRKGWSFVFLSTSEVPWRRSERRDLLRKS